ncbi:MAG: efflux RND transporter periplasmic adaptor subunit [Coprobacter sp.]|nr:efflux RND transporter periplasmic adaptor subunit [Coprobacter sp.]
MKISNFMTHPFQKVIIIALSLSLFACDKKGQTSQNAVPEYAVITLAPEAIELNSSYPATIKGCQDIEIRPNVGGFITKLCVDEGSIVRKGQLLFVIDPIPYQEAVKVAEANVKVAEANAATAELTVNNKRELRKKDIISDYDLQMAENQLATQKAVLAQAQAQLTTARNNLSYTQVTSPSDGIVGNIPFRTGSLVGPTSATPLTVVSDITKMYVYFSMNEKQILDLTRQGNGALAQMPEVQLQLADGSIYPETGKIETLSGVIDPATGAASIRATFSNPDKILRSGGSGKILVPVKNDAALVIPQKATYEIQDKRYAFVVNDSSTVKIAGIEVLPINNGQQYVVTSGLNAGDRIVVEGVGTTVRDGMTIKPITPEESAAKIQQVTQAAQK